MLMACNDLIRDLSIENIYKDDNLIVTNSVSSTCNSDDIKKVEVVIYDKDGNDMLQRPIERTYFRDKELCSDNTITGKVVKHEYFILKDIYQGKKIVSEIHPKEMDAYRSDEFKEIQLDAAWDGLVVWKKMLFKFASPSAESYIKISIQRYLKEVKNMSADEIAKAIKGNPFSISLSHLKYPGNPNNDFRHWISRTYGRQVVVAMYKEVV